VKHVNDRSTQHGGLNASRARAFSISSQVRGGGRVASGFLSDGCGVGSSLGGRGDTVSILKTEMSPHRVSTDCCVCVTFRSHETPGCADKRSKMLCACRSSEVSSWGWGYSLPNYFFCSCSPVMSTMGRNPSVATATGLAAMA
jgi:hypothetical protein